MDPTVESMAGDLSTTVRRVNFVLSRRAGTRAREGVAQRSPVPYRSLNNRSKLVLKKGRQVGRLGR